MGTMAVRGDVQWWYVWGGGTRTRTQTGTNPESWPIAVTQAVAYIAAPEYESGKYNYIWWNDSSNHAGMASCNQMSNQYCNWSAGGRTIGANSLTAAFKALGLNTSITSPSVVCTRRLYQYTTVTTGTGYYSTRTQSFTPTWTSSGNARTTTVTLDNVICDGTPAFSWNSGSGYGSASITVGSDNKTLTITVNCAAKIWSRWSHNFTITYTGPGVAGGFTIDESSPSTFSLNSSGKYPIFGPSSTVKCYLAITDNDSVPTITVVKTGSWGNCESTLTYDTIKWSIAGQSLASTQISGSNTYSPTMTFGYTNGASYARASYDSTNEVTCMKLYSCLHGTSNWQEILSIDSTSKEPSGAINLLPKQNTAGTYTYDIKAVMYNKTVEVDSACSMTLTEKAGTYTISNTSASYDSSAHYLKYSGTTADAVWTKDPSTPSYVKLDYLQAYGAGWVDTDIRFGSAIHLQVVYNPAGTTPGSNERLIGSINWAKWYGGTDLVRRGSYVTRMGSTYNVSYFGDTVADFGQGLVGTSDFTVNGIATYSANYCWLNSSGWVYKSHAWATALGQPATIFNDPSHTYGCQGRIKSAIISWNGDENSALKPYVITLTPAKELHSGKIGFVAVWQNSQTSVIDETKTKFYEAGGDVTAGTVIGVVENAGWSKQSFSASATSANLTNASRTDCGASKFDWAITNTGNTSMYSCCDGTSSDTRSVTITYNTMNLYVTDTTEEYNGSAWYSYYSTDTSGIRAQLKVYTTEPSYIKIDYLLNKDDYSKITTNAYLRTSDLKVGTYDGTTFTDLSSNYFAGNISAQDELQTSIALKSASSHTAVPWGLTNVGNIKAIIMGIKEGYFNCPAKFITTVTPYYVPIPSFNPSSYGYSGSVITPTVEKDSDGNSTFDSTRSTWKSGKSATNRGDYLAEFALNNTSNFLWEDGTITDKTIQWSITPKGVSVPTIAPSEYEYNGGLTITASESGYDSNIMTYTGDKSASELGTYEVTYALKDTNNYIWNTESGTTDDQKVTWKIVEKNIGTRLSDFTKSTPYTGSVITNGFTVSDYDGVELKSGYESGTDAGTYVATYGPKAGYVWSDAPTKGTFTGTLEITKIAGSVVVDSSTVTLTYPTLGYNTVTSNLSGGTLSVSSSDETVAKVSISGTTITLTPQPNSVDGATATITVTSASTTNYNEATTTFTVKVNLGTITLTSTPYSGEYDGLYHHATIKSDVSGIKIESGLTTSYGETITSSAIAGTEYSLKPEECNSNNYTIYYKGSGNGYKTCTGTSTITITKKSITKPSATGDSFTYSGSAQGPTITNPSSAYITQSGTTSATNAGSYKIDWVITDKTNYQWTDGTQTDQSYSWAIKRKGVNAPANVSKDYNGSSQGNDYTVPTGVSKVNGDDSGTNAGTYTAVYKVDTNHCWGSDGGTDVSNKSCVLTINKISSSITAPGNQTVALTDPTKTVSYAFTGDGTISVSSSSTSIATVSVDQSAKTITYTGHAVGTATITISGTEGTNYKAPTSQTFTIKVSNSAFSLTVTNVDVVYDGIGHMLLAKSNVAGVSVVCEGRTSTIGIAGQDLLIGYPHTDVQNQKYTIKATMSGYDDVETEGTITIRKKGVGDKPSTTVSKVYNGSTQTNGYTTPTNVTMTGDNSGLNVGTYTATYTPNANYCWATDEATYGTGDSNAVSCALSITRKASTLTPSTTSLTISPSTSSESFTYTFDGDGTISATSSNTSVCTVSIDATNKKVTVQGIAAGNATVTLSGTQGTNYFAPTAQTINVSVSNAAFTLTATGYTGTYDGAEHKATIVCNVDGVTIVSGTSTSYGNTVTSSSVAGTSYDLLPKETNAGTYTIYYKGTKSGYGDVTGSTTIKIDKQTVTDPSGTPLSFTYNKTAHVPTWSYDNTLVTIGGDYTSETDVNNYTATFTLKNNTNYEWLDKTSTAKSISWNIIKNQISDITVTDTELTYNRTEQTPTITGSTTDISFSGTTKSTNVGNWTVTYSLKDKANTEWDDGTGTADKSYTWKINKRQIDLPTYSPTTYIYDTTEKSPATVYESDYVTQSGDVKATNVGNYTINWALTYASNTTWKDNTTVDKTGAWEITKAANPMTVTTPQSRSITSSTTSAQKFNFTEQSGAVGFDSYTITSTDTDFTLTNSTTAEINVPKNKSAGSYVITVKAKANGDTNYEPSEEVITITLQIVEGLTCKITLTNKSYSATSGIKYTLNGGTETTYTAPVMVAPGTKLKITDITYIAANFDGTIIRVGSTSYNIGDEIEINASTEVNYGVKLKYFTWYGGDTLDITNISTNKEIIDTTNYNKVITALQEIAPAVNCTCSLTTVTAGTKIMATDYNPIARKIDEYNTAMSYAGSTQTKTAGTDKFLPSDLITNATSIKGALNALVNNYNTNNF